jgi:hypothetical protein
VTVTNPANAAQAPAYGTPTYPAAGTTAAQPRTTTLAPRIVAPGAVNTGTMTTQTYSSYYVPGAQPVTTTVTPMATIPYYNNYYGAAGIQPGVASPGYYSPVGTRARTSGYSSMYVTPGYATGTPTYMPAQRRGLFGGLFRRRYLQPFATAPVNYGYGVTSGGYTYGAVPAGY